MAVHLHDDGVLCLSPNDYRYAPPLLFLPAQRCSSKHHGRGTDFDLIISNAHTDEGWFFLRSIVWVNMCLS
jgi:hypothetical protein